MAWVSRRALLGRIDRALGKRGQHLRVSRHGGKTTYFITTPWSNSHQAGGLGAQARMPQPMGDARHPLSACNFTRSLCSRPARALDACWPFLSPSLT